MRDSLRASRALAHPVWWVALAALLVNDHVFKGTHALPPVLIGKLSDFAGLLVAPVLLAALLRLRSQRAIALAHLATALVRIDLFEHTVFGQRRGARRWCVEVRGGGA